MTRAPTLNCICKTLFVREHEVTCEADVNIGCGHMIHIYEKYTECGEK
jgi:hypothetical protein